MSTKQNKSYPPKKASFTRRAISDNIPDGRPATYKIQDKNGNTLYAGVAGRGRVTERLKEHLPGGRDYIRGGVKVVVRPKSSIDAARRAEAQMIKREQPPKNKQGK